MVRSRSDRIEGSLMLARQRQALILDRVREDGARPRRGPRARARRVRHDRPARPRDPRRAGPAREGPRRRDVDRRHAPCSSPGFAAKSALQQSEKDAIADAAVALVEPGMAIGVSAGTTTYALAQRLATSRADRRDQLGPGRRRPPPGRPRRPDDHPDRRRADAVGRARRTVRRRGPADRPCRPRLRGRPRHGPAVRVHLPEPARGRHGPGAHRGRPPAGRRRRPLEVGRDRDQLDRPARPGRRAHHRRRPQPRGAPHPGRVVRELIVVDPGVPVADRAARGRGARRPAISPASSRRGWSTPPMPTDPKAGRAAVASSPGSRIAATTRSSTSGSSSRPAAPAGRGWAREEPGRQRTAGRPTTRTATSARATPGRTANVNPDYDETFVFTNDFAALRPDTSDRVVDDGLLRAEGERGICRVVCFSPRHDLTLGADGAGRRPARRRRLGRPDRRARRASTAGSRSSRTAARRWAPRNPHPHGQIWAGTALPGEAPARTRRSGRTSRDTGGGCCSTTSTRSRAARGSSSRTTTGSSVVPFWAAWPFETLLIPRRPAARLPDLDDAARDDLADVAPSSCSGDTTACSSGRSRTRWAGTRRRSADDDDRPLAAPRPLLPAAAARATSASSWSATSCSPRPSAT